MASISTLLHTALFGTLVGRDQFGNRYYRSKKKSYGQGVGKPNTERRWVIYRGVAEPSKVPPAWHGWLHHITDDVPPETARTSDTKYAWEKEHLPNLTGTSFAYRPPGHVTQGAKRSKATGDYEAWKP